MSKSQKERNSNCKMISVAGDRGTGTVAKLIDSVLEDLNWNVSLVLRESRYFNGLILSDESDNLHDLGPLDAVVSTLSLRMLGQVGAKRCTSNVSVVVNKSYDGGLDDFYRGLDELVSLTDDCIVLNSTNVVVLNHLFTNTPLNMSSNKLILANERSNDHLIQACIKEGGRCLTTAWHEGIRHIVFYNRGNIEWMLPYQQPRLARTIPGKKSFSMNQVLMAIAATYAAGNSERVLQRAFDHQTVQEVAQG